MGLARRFRPDLVFLNLEAGNCYICWKRLRESTFMGQANPTIRQLAPRAKRSLRAIRNLGSTPAASPIQHTGNPRPLPVGLTGWYSAYLKKTGLEAEV
jgi:hypothetical protein